MTEPLPSVPEVCTEPLGGSALARAYAAGEAPPEWFPAAVRDPDGWRDRVRATAAEFSARRWLDPLWPAIMPHGAAAERLRRVSEQGGVLVTTGQQPGLFGGPMLTWVKALSAIALADEMERTTGVPAAPLFWSATDDADFEEARGTWLALPGGAARVAIEEAPPAGTPMSAAPLGDVSAQLDMLLRACGSAAYAPAIDAVRASYADGTTIGGAYTALLRTLLAPLGMAVLDASAPALRAAASPLLRRVARGGVSVAEALAARGRAIEAAGHRPQVAEVEGLSLVFAYEAGRKRRLTLAEAASVGDDVPLGATVLVRPVVERALLPTVAYCAGPGEVTYFAQVSAVAEALGAEQPHPVPRWSATIIEPHVARALERTGVRPEQLVDIHAAEGRLAREALPVGVSEAIATLRQAVQSTTERLASVGAALLPPPAAEASGRAVLQRLDRLERRYAAAVKRGGTERLRDLRLAHGALWPTGARQERALNFVPLLARHGPALFDAMLAEATAHARMLLGTAAVAGAPPLLAPTPGVPA